jgi:hypothetical protein
MLVTQNRPLNSPKSVTETDLWWQPQGASKFFNDGHFYAINVTQDLPDCIHTN